MMALAHGVGAVYELPLPLSFYLGGAAAAVILSFFVLVFVKPRAETAPERVLLGPRATTMLTTILRTVAFVMFIVTIVFAVLEGGSGLVTTPLLFWVGLIIITVVLQAIADGVWESANAWTTLEDLLGLQDAPRRAISIPWWAGPLLLYLLFWFELVSGEGFDSLAILIVLLLYTLFVFGFRRSAGERWVRFDPLSILFGFAGRMAPLRLDRDKIVYRGWMRRLIETDPMPPALFLSVFVLLGATTLDNVRETIGWNDFMAASGLDALPNKLIDSVALGLFVLPFLVAFTAAVTTALPWQKQRASLPNVVRRYAWSLIPIGVAYLLAHNMPLLITGLPQIVSQIAAEFGFDVFGRYAPSPRLVWFLEIGLIIGGHVLGVASAHGIALLLARDRSGAAKSHVALTAVMALFTVSTLWLLSLPLVVPS